MEKYNNAKYSYRDLTVEEREEASLAWKHGAGYQSLTVSLGQMSALDIVEAEGLVGKIISRVESDETAVTLYFSDNSNLVISLMGKYAEGGGNLVCRMEG
jgi:hypothetical protein